VSDGNGNLPLTVRVERHGVVVIVVDGELDVATAPILASALEQAATGEAPVVVDLSRVRFADCAGIRPLLATRHRLTGMGQGLAVQGPSTAVRTLFSVLGLDALLQDVAATTADATPPG